MTTHDGRGATIRHEPRPGDIGHVTALHGELYAAEFGFDRSFEAYVAESLAEYGLANRLERDRLWVVEVEGRIAGSIGIVGRDDNTAQLRWFLLHADVRGRGLGRTLVHECLAFSREAGYSSVFLWTVHVLTAAAALYTAAGFRKTESKPLAPLWGQELSEERYDFP